MVESFKSESFKKETPDLSIKTMKSKVQVKTK